MMEFYALYSTIGLALFALTTPIINALTHQLRQMDASKYWALMGLFTAIATVAVATYTGSVAPQLGGLFFADGISVFFAIVFLIVSTFVAVASIAYMKDDVNQEEYYMLLLLSTSGMILTAFAGDLLILWVAWELMSIPTFALTGFKKRDPYSNEAAVKFFVMGAMSTALILYGISLLFGVVGTTNITQILAILPHVPPTSVPLGAMAGILFIAGFGMKMGIVPFHMWLPDAFEGAPTTISAFLAAGSKKSGFAAAIRVIVVTLILSRFLSTSLTLALAILALITMTFGNVAALMQKNITRLLAYSSISQAGYILIGLATPSTLGLTGALFHVLNHAIMKSAAFIGASAVVYRISQVSLDSYKGLSKRMPVTAFTMTLILLALAGVPPLNGFMSKLVLLSAAWQGGLEWLAVAAALNSAFSLAYYAWIIKRMYIDEGDNTEKLDEPLPFTSVLIIAAVLVVALGVYPQPVLQFAEKAVSPLVHG